MNLAKPSLTQFALTRGLENKMIPHTFRVHYSKPGETPGYLDFTGDNRRARARGFSIIKQAAGFETRIEPKGY